MGSLHFIGLTAVVVFHASAATIRGRTVADHSGAPLASANVRIYKIGVRTLAADLETDGEGRFVAPELEDGEHRIVVTKPNHVDSTLRVKLSGGEFPVFVRLVRCAVVTGRVADSQGRPIRGSAVYAMRNPDGGGPLRPDFATGRWARVDSDGQYRIFNVPPGQYAVAVSYGASTLNMGGSGRADSTGVGSGVQFHPDNVRPRFLAVTGGEELRVDFTIVPTELFSVSGKVALPAPKARFWLGLAAIGQPTLAAAVAVADEEGVFRFENVPPGSYHVFVSGPTTARGARGAVLDANALFARTRVDVAGQNVEGISVTPEKGRTVTMALRGAGCNATGQIVLTSLEDWGAALERRVPMTFARPEPLTALAPAKYVVTATGLGENCYVPETALDLSGGAIADPFVLTASPAGSIRGKLLTGGRPTSEFVIELVDAENGAQIVYPDAEGKFSFGALRPGRYRIGAPKAMFDIEVVGGSPTEMELPVAPKEVKP